MTFRGALLAVGVVLLVPLGAAADTARIAFGGNPPFVDSNAQNGIVVDVLNEAFRLAGYEVEPVFVPVRRLGQELRLGNVDGIVSLIGQDIDADKYFIGEPTIAFADYVFTLKERGLNIDEPADLDGLNIVTFPTAAQIYPDWLERPSAEGRYQELTDQSLQVKMLYRGRADAVLADETIMAYLTTKHARETESEKPALARSVYIGGVDSLPAFSSETLRDAYNAGLAKLHGSGRYQEILSSYTE